MADDTKATDAGQRYAKALFDLAVETKALAAVEADLASLKKALTESADLRRLARSPLISADDQGKGLVAVATKAKFENTTANFLGLLAQNGRAKDLPAVIAGFEARYAKHAGIVAAEVVSAQPLDAKQLAAIKTALNKSLGKAPELTARVDPSILGGL